jgi:hypothetical protein
MSNSPVGWAKARSCAPCPRGNRSRGAVFRVGTARNTGVLTETSVRRLCPPYEESLFLVSRFSFLLSLPSFSYSLLAFSFATPMRRWRSAGGAQVHARHPSRHAMTGMRAPCQAPCVPSDGTLASRRSTVAIFDPGPCSPLSGIPSRIVRRPCSTHGSSLPGGAGLAGPPRRGRKPPPGTPRLAPPNRIASRSAPHERG